MHRPKSNPQIVMNRSRSQAKVIEICMDEEDSTQSTMIYPSKNENRKASANDLKADTKPQSNLLISESSVNIHSNKENICDKPKFSSSNNARAPLGQKFIDNSTNIVSPIEYKPIITMPQGQDKNLLRKKQSHETSCTSDLFNNLDVNIQEFKDLLASSLKNTHEKSHSRQPILPSCDDSRVLEISQLSLRLEESKFCTENEPSELKILKEFDSKVSYPTNNSQFEKFFQSEIKAPDVTEEYEFMETWRMMERKIDSSQLEHSGDPDNLSIDGSFKEIKSQREEGIVYGIPEMLERRERESHQDFPSRKASERGSFHAFQEDYIAIFESFKKIMPDFETKSHIMRYLTGHESLGFEFLYSIMLDLKEIEKHVFLMYHKNTSREEFLKEQLFEMAKSNQKHEKEVADLHSKIEERTNRSSRESTRPRMTSMHVRGHYQALLLRLNEFYGEKMDILKQTLTKAKSFDQTKIAINDVPDDLMDEIQYEEMQDVLKENMNKITELHSLIEESHKERSTTGKFEKPERRISGDFSSIGALTNGGLDTLERNEFWDGREEQETQLNISEAEMSRFEILLREKQDEVDIVRKKEQMYQNVIYSLTKELRQMRGEKARAMRESLQEREIDLLFKEMNK